MNVDITVRVVAPAPFLLRTAHDGRALCESLGYLPPELSEHPQALADAVDRDVERAESVLRDDASPERAELLVGVRAGAAIAHAVYGTRS